MTQSIADKASMRKQAVAARKSAHSTVVDAGASLTADLPTLPTGSIVSGYVPIRSEIDPMPLMRFLLGAGHRICVPVIEDTARPLRFRRWTPDADMIEGAFGTAIPANGDWLQPAVLLVPLLAFDRRGYRLGYGGGFYDRTLQALRGQDSILAIGLAYSAQEMTEVPIEPTDQPLDMILTEAELIRPNLIEAP